MKRNQLSNLSPNKKFSSFILLKIQDFLEMTFLKSIASVTSFLAKIGKIFKILCFMSKTIIAIRQRITNTSWSKYLTLKDKIRKVLCLKLSTAPRKFSMIKKSSSQSCWCWSMRPFLMNWEIRWTHSSLRTLRNKLCTNN